jgi:aspartate racemase
MKRPKTIGILGGMGPEATAHFFRLIIRLTKAARDQEHLPVVVNNEPRVPDRTAAVLCGGPSPLPRLVKGAEVLARAGADFIVIPCVTAHYYLERLRRRSSVPVLSLVEAAAERVSRLRPAVKKIGLLATSGTVAAGVLHDALESRGIAVITPGKPGQERLMRAIYGRKGIKAGATEGEPRETVVGLARELVAAGAQAIVAGCTEVPLVLRQEDIGVPLVDPMEEGARVAVKAAGGRLRPRPAGSITKGPRTQEKRAGRRRT